MGQHESAGASAPAGERAGPGTLSRRSLIGGAGTAAAGTALAMTLGGGVAKAATTTKEPGEAKDGNTACLPSAKDIPHRSRLVDYEIVELAALLRAGKVSSVELTQAYLDRIHKFNGPFETYGNNGLYNAFVRLDEAGALAAARAADKRLAACRRGGEAVPLLYGIPMGIKDSVGVKGLNAQNGSAAFSGNLALQDATVVARLRAAGVVLLGSTICSAFSGSITGTFAGNAWNVAYVPGGSSQGSGVAPVARLAAACIGEETGGSIIMPSAANGATGIKPSLGTVSVAGVMPLSPGYDVLGPLSRSARDSALILATILGPDPVNDPQTLSAPSPFPEIPLIPRRGRKPLQGMTIGIPQTDWMNVNGSIKVGVSPQSTYGAGHLAAFNRLVGQLQSLGATVIQFPGLDMTDSSQNPYFASSDVLATVDGSPVSPSAAVVNSNRYEVRFAAAVADFCASGIPSAAAVATLTSQYGRRAPGEPAASFAAADRFNGGISAAVRYEGEQRRRRLIANYTKALRDHNVDFMLVMSIGDVVGQRSGGAGFPVYRAYYQVPNALGWPMVSFPIGYVQGLAASAQFWGPRFAEADIVQAAIDYQDRFPEYHNAAPPDPAPPATPSPNARSLPSFEDDGPSNDPIIGEAEVRAALG
ncbi:amidase [Microbispora sp. RL4-1S]|uniref:Amidase n=1 Tax=Microbispora oryzae TaxID=2806554 RepID=A0A940WRZ9_9ACTN|nr:amidase [Microbispora oryzae]MBP2706380.1 amidase [Microbispora oryzae]